MEIQLNCIKKAFDKKEVLKGIDFTFQKGKIYGLLGRNGAGKTTLFNCLSGDVTIDSGTVQITEDGQTRKLEDTDIGYVLSTPILPEFLTGYEFIKFMIDINKDNIEENQNIDAYFDMVKMEHEDRHRLIKGYSHGMKNKLQMLTFMITRPPVILLDEPLTSFDVIVALEMKNLLKRMKGDHILIFSTHILQLATDLCDDIVILHHGLLSSVDSLMIHSNEFEAKIFEILKEDSVNATQNKQKEVGEKF